MHGRMFTIKSTKPTSSKDEPMIMFGGSPIKVAVPPILLRITSDIKYGRGSTCKILHMSMVTGASNNMVVTLSKNALAIAVRKESNANNLRKDLQLTMNNLCQIITGCQRKYIQCTVLTLSTSTITGLT